MYEVLSGPVVTKAVGERIVMGPVLVPNIPDSDGDTVTPEQIKRVQSIFMEHYENIDLQHSLKNVGKIIESYITPIELTFDKNGQKVVIPKDSWMLSVKVTDDDAWDLVQRGLLTGFSIMAITPPTLKSKDNTTKADDIKRVTLADLGENFIVNAVSLVDEPAVPAAKFLVVKSKWEKLKEVFTSKKADNIEPHNEEEVEQNMDELKIQEMLHELLLPLFERIEAIEAQLQPKEEEVVEEEAVKAEEQEEKPEGETEEAPVEEAPEEEQPQEEQTEEQPEEEEVEKAEGEEVPAEEDEIKAQLQEALAKIAELEKAQKSAYSKRLTGQDGEVPSTKSIKKNSDRDAFGRKIR